MNPLRPRISRRGFLAAAGVVAAGAVVAACTPAATQAPAATATSVPATLAATATVAAPAAASATSAPTATLAATAVPVAEITGDLEVMHFLAEGAAYYDFMVTLGDEFAAAHPQVNFKFTWGGSDFVNQFRARVLANDPPTVATANSSQLRGWAAEGLAVKLDEYLDGQNFDGTGRWLDDFAPSIRSMMPIDPASDGPGYYTAPYEAFINSIWYNTQIYEQLGLQEPKTWDEFLANCAALKDGGFWPIAHDGNISDYNRRWYYHLVGSVVGGDKFLATALNEAGTSWKDEPGFLQTAQLVYDLYVKEYFQPGYQGYQWPAAQIDFANGRAGMILMSSGLYSEIKDAIPEGFSMSTFNTPVVEGGQGDGPTTIWEFKYNAFFVPVGSKNIEAAVEWMKFNTSRGVEERQAGAEGLFRPPALPDIPMPGLHAGTARMLKEATKAYPREFGVDYLAPDWLKQVYAPLYDQFFYGQITPEDFIDQLQTAHDKFYGN